MGIRAQDVLPRPPFLSTAHSATFLLPQGPGLGRLAGSPPAGRAVNTERLTGAYPAQSPESLHSGSPHTDAVRDGRCIRHVHSSSLGLLTR